MDWYLKMELMLGIFYFFSETKQHGWAEPKKELRHHKRTNASSEKQAQLVQASDASWAPSFQINRTGRRLQGTTTTRWKYHTSHLVWDSPEEKENSVGERHIWSILHSLLTL